MSLESWVANELQLTYRYLVPFMNQNAYQNAVFPPMPRWLAAQGAEQRLLDRNLGILCCCCEAWHHFILVFHHVGTLSYLNTTALDPLGKMCVLITKPSMVDVMAGHTAWVILVLFAQVLDSFRARILGWCEHSGGLLWLVESTGR